MSSESKLQIKDLVANLQDEKRYEDLSWKGSFDDYLELVKTNPRITRNAFQRMYDMIILAGTESYKDAKKEITHYKFFDDIPNNGKDAVFGLDISLMKLVNVLKSAALGYGTEKRVILLHGPVGSAKSTICRVLKKEIEEYSKTNQGAMYTFEWVDEAGKLGHIFGEDVRVFESPMHEEPLLLIPEKMRSKIFQRINKASGSEFKVNVEGEICPPSRFIFSALMDHYNGEIVSVLNHVRVKRLALSEADRIGIGTFQPKDEKTRTQQS